MAEKQENNEKFYLRRGSGYGGYPYHAEQVLRDREGRMLFVQRISKEYYREDGLSFGVGDDSGFIYHATCRLATDEEAAPVIKERARTVARLQAKERARELKRHIQVEGECPKGVSRPEGERVLDNQDVHGGGDWFVLGSEWVWYVRNNGMDGDCWARNNVETGGAGAIGWRVPTIKALSDELQAIAEVLKL